MISGVLLGADAENEEAGVDSPTHVLTGVTTGLRFETNSEKLSTPVSPELFLEVRMIV
jgi:hypothetical protein